MFHSLDYIQKSTISEAYGNTSQVVLVVKNLPANAGYTREVVSIPGPGRSPGGGNGNPLQYSCLENPMDRGACQATVHRVTKIQTWLKQLSKHVWSTLKGGSEPWTCGGASNWAMEYGSVQFCHSVMSESLQPHEPRHTRPPCPSPTAGVHPNPCPSSQWCHPTILSSTVPFSSCTHLSQHQGLFKWVSSLHQVAKVLEFQLHHQSF